MSEPRTVSVLRVLHCCRAFAVLSLVPEIILDRDDFRGIFVPKMFASSRGLARCQTRNPGHTTPVTKRNAVAVVLDPGRTLPWFPELYVRAPRPVPVPKPGALPVSESGSGEAQEAGLGQLFGMRREHTSKGVFMFYNSEVQIGHCHSPYAMLVEPRQAT